MEHTSSLAGNTELHRIVSALYTDHRVRQFINRLQPADLRDDLLQHCTLEVYRIAEKYPGKIEALHTSNQLWPWFVGAIKQQLMSKKSTFYTKHRRQFAPEEMIPRDQVEWPDPDLSKKGIDESIWINYVYTVFETKPKVLKYNLPKQGNLFN
jgi:hypothetical protein